MNRRRKHANRMASMSTRKNGKPKAECTPSVKDESRRKTRKIEGVTPKTNARHEDTMMVLAMVVVTTVVAMAAAVVMVANQAKSEYKSNSSENDTNHRRCRCRCRHSRCHPCRGRNLYRSPISMLSGGILETACLSLIIVKER